MNLKTRTALGIITAFLGGCQGTLSTHPASEAEQAGNYDGILFYPSTLMEESSQTTIRLENGKITATSTGTPGTSAYCRPVTTSKILVAADFTKPRVINYRHGILESYTFNVTITDGMLNSVNTTSTPDQGKTLSNLAGAAKDAGTLAAAVLPGAPKPDLPCTDGSVATGRRAIVARQGG